MTKLSNIQVSKLADKLTTFAQTLPFDSRGKGIVVLNILIDFYDALHFDDEQNPFTFEEYYNQPNNPKFKNVKFTTGITTTCQLIRYIKNLVLSLQKVRLKAFEKYFDGLDELDPQEKAYQLSLLLGSVSRKEAFQKHGLRALKDPPWFNEIQRIIVSDETLPHEEVELLLNSFEEFREPTWFSKMKDLLAQEYQFAKEQAALKPATKKESEGKKQINQDMTNDLLLVEELEKKLALEAVDYRRKCDDYWEEYKFDPTYFDSYISGPLLNEFSKSVYERIRPLNNQEINRYLSLSLQQFKTHTPPKRHKAFLLNYHNTYWYPNVMEYKANEYDNRYATHVWKHYANHFQAFKEAFQKIYDDFKAGLVGTNETTKPTISEENFRIFLNALAYNYPIDNAPYVAYLQWKDNLSYLKKEVLSNLIHLDQSARKPYISSLRFELEELLTNSQTTQDELEKLFLKYDTTEEQLLRNRSFENPLHIAIYDEPPKFEDTFEKGFNPDTGNIQFTFYNFHYGEIIREAVKFLDEQAFEYGFGTKVETPPPPIKTKPSALSFKYINLATGLQNLTDLMNSLKRSALIHKDTTHANFRRVFSEKEIEQKIIWTGNISELSHFIKTLHNTAKKVQDTKQKQWEISINCFEMADKTELTRDKLRRQKNKKIAKAAIIEKAVNIL